MKKIYNSPQSSIVKIGTTGEVMDFNIPVSGGTTPEESDSKEYHPSEDVWDEEFYSDSLQQED